VRKVHFAIVSIVLLNWRKHTSWKR